MKRPRIRAGGYFSRGFAARSRALRVRISLLRRSCARLDKTAMLRRLPKMYFLFYLRTQILPIDSYVLNSKSAAFQSIWLKFGKSDAIYLFYKTVSANFNTPFHFKARAFFPQGVLTNCPPQLQLLIKEKQRNLSKI